MRLPRIIGTIIPFIGFREIEADEGLRRFLDLAPGIEVINTFQLEWLGMCVIIPIRPDE